MYNVSVHEGPQGVGTVLFEKGTFGVMPTADAVLGYTMPDEAEDSSSFDLDFTTGRLLLRKALDRKRKSLIKLRIRVRDYAARNKDQIQSDATIEIHVMDYNDRPPIFEAPLYVVNVSENASVSASGPLLIVKATDEDEGMNGQFMYGLLSKGDQSETYFRLHPETGALSLAKRLDYEKQKKHQLTVVAKDFGSPSLSSTAMVSFCALLGWFSRD